MAESRLPGAPSTSPFPPARSPQAPAGGLRVGPRRRGWLRGFTAGTALTGLGIALRTAAPLASAACDGHECDNSTVDYGCFGDSPDYAVCCSQGWMQDDGQTWVTTKPGENWLPFGANETIRLHYNAWVSDRDYELAGSFIYIAPAPPEGANDPFPDALPDGFEGMDGSYDNATLASGNLGEFASEPPPGQAWVTNGTCAPNLVLVSLHFPPPEGGAVKGPCWKRQEQMEQAKRADAGRGDAKTK